RIRAGNVDDYYEVVLSEMVSDGDRSFGAVDFPARDWHEIDTLDDLHVAERAVTTPEWTMSRRPLQRAVAASNR
ncbi:MAG: hypothetical protein ABGW98_00215, partial [Myxococcales bacterium]